MATRRPRKTDEENFRGDVRSRAERITTTVADELASEEMANAAIDAAAKEVERRNTKFQSSHHFNVSKQGTKEIPSMSMIDPTEWSLEDSQEPYALKDGTEAMLRIIEVRYDKRPGDSAYYTVRFEVPSEPFSKDITEWFNVPELPLDAKRLNAAKQKMWHFMDGFAIDRTRPSDPLEDWVGQEGWCILSLSKSEQYGEQNRISRFILPR